MTIINGGEQLSFQKEELNASGIKKFTLKPNNYFVMVLNNEKQKL